MAQTLPTTHSRLHRPHRFAGKRVVIVGGGFAGLNAAKTLGEKTDRDGSLQITLIDRRNYHLFQPLLYQVAMAGLNAGEIAIPLRTVLSSHRNTRVLLAEALDIDLSRKRLKTDAGELEFDYLIMACGAQHSYFGREDWEPFAPGLKTLEQATEVRRRVLLSFEMAEREADPARICQLLTFVVVGGGPTGVELAGALGEISRFTLSTDFRHIDPTSTRIILIEAGDRILSSFHPDLSARAQKDLENLGVVVRTKSRVTNINPTGVSLGDECIQAATVLWAAGVMPSEMNSRLGTPTDRAGRVMIEKDLTLPGHPDVFVLGDQAHFDDHGKPLPGLAPVAMQQGHAAAKSILNDMQGKRRKAFRYFDKGQMATIGRKKAVAQAGKFRFGGTLAWYAWLFVHVYYMVGFKSRFQVLLQWFWSYVTYKRGAQLITTREWRSFDSPEKTPPRSQPLPKESMESKPPQIERSPEPAPVH
jgi:NADH:ubiquinone reductase (H+-translocating)